jgi:hypothetical protein
MFSGQLSALVGEIQTHPGSWTAVFIVLLCFSTYLKTTLSSFIATKYGSDPPTVPYWIPFLGSAIPFVKDTAGFLSRVK